MEEQDKAIAGLRDEIEDLAQSEKSIRESTRSQRLVFVAIIAIVVVVIALIVWLVLFRG